MVNWLINLFYLNDSPQFFSKYFLPANVVEGDADIFKAQIIECDHSNKNSG